MDYYEELGVARTASLAELRRSYRCLVRLLHPDQCADENLRLLAGLQMKRLNHILSVLTDAEQRCHYDAGLDAPPRKRNLSPWLWRAAEVAALSGALVYWQSGDPLHVVRSQPSGSKAVASAAPPPSACPAPEENVAALKLARRELERLRADRRKVLDQAVGSRAAAAAPDVPDADPPPDFKAMSERPLPVSAESLPLPRAEAASKRLAGNWYFVPRSPQAASRGLYPPEYIELKLTEEGGVLRGRYWGRYKISDRAIPPDVIFRFEGPSDARSARLPWTGPRDAQGHVTLRLVADDILEVTWLASRLSTDLGLASGTAQLIRQRTP